MSHSNWPSNKSQWTTIVVVDYYYYTTMLNRFLCSRLRLKIKINRIREIIRSNLRSLIMVYDEIKMIFCDLTS